MSRPHVLVTGGCGFLGSEIVSALLATNRYSITALDIAPPRLGTTAFTDCVRYVRANVLDAGALSDVFDEARPDLVVHAAGVISVGSARYVGSSSGSGRRRRGSGSGSKSGSDVDGGDSVWKVNVEGTRNVVAAAQANGVRGFVYTSSVTVVVDELARDWLNVDEAWPAGGANTVYGQSKAAAESLVLAASTPAFPTCALRVAPILGPHDPILIPSIHACIAARNTPFILGTGTNLNDYIYVSNAADAHILAVANLLTSQTAAGEAFFISNGTPVPLRDLCCAVWREFGHVPPFEVHVPEALARWVACVTEGVAWLIGADAPFSRGLVSDACRVHYVDIRKARAVLGYRPKVQLDEGVRLSCQHFKKREGERGRR